MIFPYLSIPPDDVSRPLLRVTLFGALGEDEQQMIVDSGADISVMPARIARELGMPLNAGQSDSFEVADGTMAQAVVLDIAVETCGERFVLPVAFLERDNISPLLGQRGFFDRFEIRFRRSDGEFEVLPRKAERL